MFQFPGFPSYTYLIQYRIHDSSSWGFPHSEIHGSMLIYSSPWLIAVSHVLLRLLMPRHSPYALCNLNLLFSYFALSFAISFYRFGCLFFYHPLVAKLQFLTFFLGKTNFYLFLLLSQYLFVCFIRFSMIICIHSISSIEWSVWMDSNHRPRAYQARALTTWATDRGGDDGIRTHDPLLAGQVLSQLSYTPMDIFSWVLISPWKLNNNLRFLST